jgi:ZIP family zinc transporter
MPTVVELYSVAGVGLLGFAAIALGGVYGGRRPLTAKQRSAFQHVAAGTVFAGLVTDVFAKLLSYKQAVAVPAVGLTLGTVGMLLIRLVTDRAGKQGLSLAVTTITDVIVDGLLMGMSMTIGGPTAIEFAVALAPEMVLLGMTLAAELGQLGIRGWRRPGIPVFTGAGILAAALAGLVIERSSATAAPLVFGFGAAAIAYFVMEELLREAHRQLASPVMAALFFAGFLPFFIAGMAL